MSLFSSAPEPPTELGRYRVLSSTAGVRVSPLQLGAMSIGDAWEFMGHMSKEQSFKLLDEYYKAGGNFIDTANNYQNEQSETWIGEWMKERNNRDHMIVATKFTTPYRSYKDGQLHVINASGNHKRSLRTSLRDSLAKLQTDFIDLLYVHWWDWTTSVEELMDSLDEVVKQGKVLYLGVSDTPAYIVSACNMYARAHNKTQFSVYQGRWNLIVRDMEREVIPMCRHFGMAIAPWDAMGGGRFQSKTQMEERRKNNEGLRTFFGPNEQSEPEAKASEALLEVAKEHGLESPTTIALAYVLCKAPHVFPIVGGRKVEHLHDNIKALTIKLSDQQIQKLESVVPFDVGFPNNFIGEDPHVTGETSFLTKSAGPLSIVQASKAIGHE